MAQELDLDRFIRGRSGGKVLGIERRGEEGIELAGRGTGTSKGKSPGLKKLFRDIEVY